MVINIWLFRNFNVAWLFWILVLFRSVSIANLVYFLFIRFSYSTVLIFQLLLDFTFRYFIRFGAPINMHLPRHSVVVMTIDQVNLVFLRELAILISVLVADFTPTTYLSFQIFFCRMDCITSNRNLISPRPEIFWCNFQARIIPEWRMA